MSPFSKEETGHAHSFPEKPGSPSSYRNSHACPPDLHDDGLHVGSSSPVSAFDDLNRSFCSSAPSVTTPSLDAPLPLSDSEHEDSDAHRKKNLPRAVQGQAAAESKRASAVSPAVLAALRAFDRLRSPSTYTKETEARSDFEVLEIDISPQDYRLLWWLLGQDDQSCNPHTSNRDQKKSGSGSLSALQLLSLHQGGLGHIASVEQLRQLGSWVLDSVRYDFVRILTAAPGQSSTRLHIRMPLYIHDKTAHDVGDLLKSSIQSVFPEVSTYNGFKCRFTNKFYQMIDEERRSARRQRRDAAQTVRTRSQAREQSTSRSQPPPLRIALGPARAQGQAVAIQRDEEEDQSRREDSPEDAVSVAQIAQDEEKLRYEEANPDVCVYLGDENMQIIPAIVIEVGYSHPLPFDRARSYIYGSDGQCRMVICLDIEYRDHAARLRSYQQMQQYGGRPPPHKLTLNVFRCKIETAGEYDTYAATHELKDIDIRESARLGKELELKTADLVDPDEDDESEDQQESDTIIRIPYEAIVKLVDNAAWGQAIRDDPSLLPSKKRKRGLIARRPSPEAIEDDALPRRSAKRRSIRHEAVL